MSSCREKKRDHRASTKRVEYHVQFFSWNNESARLCKTMPSKDEYRKCIDTISKNKLLAVKKFASSWERDGQEAEIKEKGRKIAHPTLNMSRREVLASSSTSRTAGEISSKAP